MIRGWVVALLLASCAAPETGPSAAPAPELGLVDAHLHYSQITWSVLPADAAVARLRASGIRRALVSSTPDDGTLRLYDRAPDLIVPILRPYRRSEDLASWTTDETLIPYLEQRLARGIYRGIGELHLSAEQTLAPVVRRVIALAVERDIVLQVHGDDRAVEEIVRLEPRARVLWAHAGMSASPGRVERLIALSPTLLVELALRSDVAPGGTLDPDWRDLFVRHADRFLVGTDTWVNEQWERYAEIQREKRAWLAQLPRDVAERIAYRNGERLFPLVPAAP